MKKEKVTAVEGAEKTPKKASTKDWVSLVIGIILCAMLLPMLVANCILIVQNFINPDEPPSIGGVTPLIVLSGSMDPLIKENDIIFVSYISAEDVKEGDVIAFFDPMSKSNAIATHRVMDIYTDEESGKTYAVTAGDANVRNSYETLLRQEEENPRSDGTSVVDEMKEEHDKEKLDHSYLVYKDNSLYDRVHLELTEKNVVGKYTYVRIPFIGQLSIAMQTTVGWIICIVTPLLLFIIYEIVKRKKQDKGRDAEKEALLAELEALRAAAQSNAPAVEEASTIEEADDPPNNEPEDVQTADTSEAENGESAD